MISATPRDRHARRLRVEFQGEDASLAGLLRDVLREDGIDVVAEGDRARPADAVLIHVPSRASLQTVRTRMAEAEGERAPKVIAVLSFDDEHLARLALAAGAHACFALGQPLSALTRLIGRRTLG